MNGLVVALFLGLAAPAAAQQGTITGRVTDIETGTPLDGAQLQVQGGGQNTGGLSNAQGNFNIQVPAGNYSIVVEYLGYRSERVGGIQVRAGETTTVEIQLTSIALVLDGVVVSASRGQPEKQVEAVATTHLVGGVEIQERSVATPSDHLRSALGVDIITHGVQATNVVLRGFNNIFSGSLHALTDYRLAGVPSLRVNLLHFIPANNEDIDRMEVVLGPGSALYGPNTANGVLHILTKSPLESQGTTVSLAGAGQSSMQGTFRSAILLNDNLGVKLSGQFLQGTEWEYLDLGEQAARAAANADPAGCVATMIGIRHFSASLAQAACNRVGVRNYDLLRYGLEARADYRFADDGTAVFTWGRTSAKGIELTGLGAGQTEGWAYQFLQARLRKGRFFTQAYLNSSDAGDTFLLRDGAPLIDKSKLFVVQAQHGFDLFDGRQDFTYGIDFVGTRPDTEGTINGSYENSDNMDEWGFYVQSKTELMPKLDLVVAGRLDSHSALAEDVFSPRAALVFKPTDDQSFRFTYNRAFSTPSSLNLFLDISAGAAPNTELAALGYTLRAFGTGPDGYSFQNPDGTLKGMLSPFNPSGSDQLLPANIAVMWPLAVGAAANIAAARGTPFPADLLALLGSLQPTATDVGITVLDPITGGMSPLESTTIRGVPPIQETNTETFELGWQGVLGNQLSFTADVYYSKVTDFTSPLTLTTPLLLVNGVDAGAYMGPAVLGAMIPQLMQLGLTYEQAYAQALSTVGDLALAVGSVPVGVVSSPEVAAQGADLIVAYLNMGGMNYWGADLGVSWFLDDKWTLSGTYSRVSDDYFDVDGAIPGTTEHVALNAPKHKATLTAAYRNVPKGFNAEARVRYTAEFPSVSAGYTGTKCLLTAGEEPGLFDQDCVAASTLVDLNLGYLIPDSRATIQLSVNNLFNSAYRSFVGVPEIGRFAMLRVKYDLF
ncbi:TonB-dependent receptor domain-containing protein [Gemmatimonadota bacterium]